MNQDHAIRLFCLNNLTIESEIQAVENRLDIDCGHRQEKTNVADEEFYPQFPEKVRRKARGMANNYVVFYCLENSIRDMIVSRLADPLEFGEGWWEQAVPDFIRTNAKKNMENEATAVITPRSSEPIDYINFGELGIIIEKNWAIFGETLSDVRAVKKIMASLNVLRAPIAHCKPLAEDEELRLHLTLRDWFRQMS